MIELFWVNAIDNFKTYVANLFYPTTTTTILEAGDFTLDRLNRNKLPIILFSSDTLLSLTRIGKGASSNIRYRIWVIDDITLPQIETKLNLLYRACAEDTTLNNQFSSSNVETIDAYLGEGTEPFTLPFSVGYKAGSITIALNMMEA